MSGIIAQNAGRHTGLVKAASGGGEWTLIKTLTSDGSDDDLTFVNGTDDVTFDATYDEYYFLFKNMHPETDGSTFSFNMTTDGSNWNVTKTSAAHYTYHNANTGATELSYATGDDLAQGTAFQNIAPYTENQNYSSCSGFLRVFAPADTTFAKHYISEGSSLNIHPSAGGPYNWFFRVSGYGNTTSAITGIQFKFSSFQVSSSFLLGLYKKLSDIFIISLLVFKSL